MHLPKDPVIRELLPEFIEDWLQQLDTQFATTLADHNGKELYRLGHTLKGSCFQFELNHIAEKGITLMAKANDEQWDDAAQLIGSIKTDFEEARDFLASQS